ncbi:hypothetical protein HMI54_015151 [Coelomomyces lativittatus]|nr:hypothetical protein HMI56_000882 [Coelomomyces lativittatus]KAJ1513249.1 hypothetical protein HMI54_015151 [Coelomomyces lativittatus]KAJ1517331.1 hypothetical protein HMI55_000042 [Coelomomyces lativittatus]
MFLVYFLALFFILFSLPLVNAQFRSSGFVFNVPQLNVDGSMKQYNFSMALSNAPNAECTVFFLTELYSMSNCTVQFNNSNWDRPVEISAVPFSLFSNFTGNQTVPIRLRSFCDGNSPFHNVEGMLPTIRSGFRGSKASVSGAMNIVPFGQTLPYSYQTPGFYYLLRSPYLTIEALTSSFMGNSVVMTGLFVRYGDYVFAFDPSVSDKSKTVVEITPEVPRKFRILNSKTSTSDVFTANFPDGATMVVDVITTIVNGQSLSYLNLYLEIPPSYKNMVGGLLGGLFDNPDQTFYLSFGGFVPPTTIYSSANIDTTGSFSLNFLRSFAESWKVPTSDNINLCRAQCSGTNVGLVNFPFRECGVVNFAFSASPIRVPDYIIANLTTDPTSLFNLPAPVDPFVLFPTTQPPVNVVPTINVPNFNLQSMSNAEIQQQQITPMGSTLINEISPFRAIVAPSPLPLLPTPNAAVLNNATRFCSTRIQPVVGSNVDTAPFIKSCEIDIRRQLNPDTVANFYALQYTRMASRSILSMTTGQNQDMALTARNLAKQYDFGNFTCRSNCRVCAVEGCVLCMTPDLESRSGICEPVAQRPFIFSTYFPTSSNILLTSTPTTTFPLSSFPVFTPTPTNSNNNNIVSSLLSSLNQNLNLASSQTMATTTPGQVTNMPSMTNPFVTSTQYVSSLVTVNGLVTMTTTTTQQIFLTTTFTQDAQVFSTAIPVQSQSNGYYVSSTIGTSNPTATQKSIFDIPLGQLFRSSAVPVIGSSLNAVMILTLTIAFLLS